jgi:hypothetical protein
MSAIWLPIALTAVMALLIPRFFRDLKKGVIHTRAADVYAKKSPRRFAFTRALSFGLMPILFLMLAALWLATLSRILS